MAAATPVPTQSGHVQANGVSYYYEMHGQGEPLLLLHGGFGSIGMFGPVLAMLAQSRQVIGVDLQGHGRTPLGERELSLPDMGADMALLLGELGFEQVDVMGYSFGAGVAFRLAVQHPERVRRLVLVSAGYARDGFYREILAMQAQVNAGAAAYMKDTPMYQRYAAIAPNPDDFPMLLDRMGELVRQPYDWAEDVKRLSMPVMLVYGDSDMYRPEHVVQFYQLLGGGLKDAGWMREHLSPNRLAILPDLTHYEIFAAPALAATVLPFLNGESGVQSGVEQVARAANGAAVGEAMAWKLEVVVVPVSDVDRAKQFYSEQVGFVVDVDHQASETVRVVQLTPPGSACSVTIGTGLVDSAPGSLKGLQLVVADIETAHAQLVERGVEVSPIQHVEEGVWLEGRGGPWNSFIFFSDPDGNGWAVQERPAD